MEQRDIDTIISLSRQGKQTTKIWEENYPELDYEEVHDIIYGAGEMSSRGAKQKISNKISKIHNLLNQKSKINKLEIDELVTEIDELVCFLYERHKASQKKLDSVREIINS